MQVWYISCTWHLFVIQLLPVNISCLFPILFFLGHRGNYCSIPTSLHSTKYSLFFWFFLLPLLQYKRVIQVIRALLSNGKNHQIPFLLHKNRNYAVENLIFLRLDPYLKPQSHIHPMSCSLRLIYFALPFFFSVPDSLLSSSHIFISNTRAISYIFFHYNNDQINMSIHTHVFHLKNTSYRRSCFNSLFRLFSFIFFFLQCVKRLSLLHQSPSDDYPSSASQQFNSGWCTYRSSLKTFSLSEIDSLLFCTYTDLIQYKYRHRCSYRRAIDCSEWDLNINQCSVMQYSCSACGRAIFFLNNGRYIRRTL